MSYEQLIQRLLKESFDALDKELKQSVGEKVTKIIETHAALSIPASLVPVPGLDVAATVGNIWTMYVRINEALNLPFSENVLRSIASGLLTHVVTAIPSLAIVATVGTALKLFPGIGTAAGDALELASLSSITTVMGVTYVKALSTLVANKQALTDHNLQSAVHATATDHAFIKQAFHEAKEQHGRRHKRMNSGPTLMLGLTGPDVTRLQRILVMIKSLGPADITGNFGPNTQTAVEDFQSGNGLTVDGIVGPATWQALPADPDTPLLAQGANGPVVVALQTGLQRYSVGESDPAASPGTIDGIFGPLTHSAVCAYQTSRLITADGIVGDITWWTPAGAAGATLASLSGLVTA